MALEIERKFLVNLSKWNSITPESSSNISQSYLSIEHNKSIRVRILDKTAFLTIKGTIDDITKDEFEYEIPLTDAQELISKYGTKTIEKTRHYITLDNQTWEIDEFHNENNGLIVAEAELTSADQSLTLPDWILKEVSGENKYYNSQLANHPYKNW